MKRVFPLTALFTLIVALCYGQSNLKNLVPKTSSGTEYAYAQSDWHYSLGDAERDCIQKIEGEISSIVSSLESGGKRVVGSTHYSIDSEEREVGDKVEYRCSSSSEINWVENNSLNKNKQKGIDLSDKMVVQNNPSFTILEDELLNRFKKKYKKSYTTMEFNNIVVLESNVSVKDKISSLPSSFSEEIYVSENPTNTQQTKNIKISVSTTEGERVTLDKSITTRNETQFGFGFTAKVFNANGSIKQSIEMKIGSSRETSRTINRTYTEEFSQKVEPYKTLIIKIKREVLTDLYKLGGYLVFDGEVKIIHKYKDVYACGPFGLDRCSRTKTSTQTLKLSQLLSLEERTLNLDGQVTISSSENTKTTTSYAITDLPSKDTDDELNKGKTLTFVNGQDFYIIKTLPANIKMIDVEKK